MQYGRYRRKQVDRPFLELGDYDVVITGYQPQGIRDPGQPPHCGSSVCEPHGQADGLLAIQRQASPLGLKT